MNERIKELAEQAGMKPCADMSKFGMNEDMNPYNCQEFMLEKFAELLVRECADLFEVEYGQSVVSGNEVAQVLKNRFGVE